MIALGVFAVVLALFLVPTRIKSRRKAKQTGTPGRMGHPGPGGGAWTRLLVPPFFRGTSNQIAGLYPFLLSTGAPIIGVPIGRIQNGRRRGKRGAVLCVDPISWYEIGKLISNPSAFILGLPGLGKSTLIRRWILGLDYFGVKSLILGDLKGEYVQLIRDLGGQVIRVGRGQGYLNVLDMGDAIEAAQLLIDAGQEELAKALLAEAKGRRQSAVETLLTIHRSTAPSSDECSILSVGLAILDRQVTDRTPILADLLVVIQAAHAELHEIALSRGSVDEYRRATRQLESDLVALSKGHGLGEIFSKETTTPLRRRQHAVYDVHTIDDNDRKLQAAALMLCWGIGFGQVAVSNALADAGLEDQQPVHIVMDELWRAFRAGSGLVDRGDNLTRLNRDKGVGVTFASHTFEDLEALPTEEDRAKAAGIPARCGMVIAFGLPASEMPRLAQACRWTNAEKRTLTSWTTPESLMTRATRGRKKRAAPGQGSCLVKVGASAALAAHVDLVPEETPYNNTSARWAA